MESELASLSDYVVVLRRHRRLIAALALIGVAVGVVATYVLPKTYEGQATILLRPQGVSLERAFDDDTLVDLETAGQLVVSRAVATRVSERLAGEGVERSPDVIAARVGVTQGESDLLKITARDGTPEVAAATATAAAEEYLAFAREQLELSIAEATAQLEEAQAAATEQLGRIEATLATSQDDPAARSALENERVLLLAQLTEIQRSLVDAKGLVITPGRIIDDAEVPSSPVSPVLWLDVVLGLAVGLLAGVAIAFVRERASDRLTTESTLSEEFGLRLLGSVPGGRQRLGRTSPPPLVLPGSTGGERYRRALSGVVHAAGGVEEGRVVLLVSPVDPGVAGGVAANLAIFAASAGYRVDLLETDLRYPSVHHYFRLPPAPGSADVLRGDRSFIEVARSFTEVPGLRVTPVGNVNLDAARLVQPRGLRTLVEAAKSGSELVLLDSPPLLEVADALVLAELADCVVMVVDPARSRRREVELALADLRRGGVEPDGVILLGGTEGLKVAPVPTERGRRAA